MKMDFPGPMDEGTMYTYGLVVRAQPTASAWRNATIFRLGQIHDSLYGDNICYTIDRITNAAYSSLTGDYYWCFDDSMMNFSDWNNLKVSVIGSSMRFYINNIFMQSVASGNMASGKIGIESSNGWWATGSPDSQQKTYVAWVTVAPPIANMASLAAPVKFIKMKVDPANPNKYIVVK